MPDSHPIIKCSRRKTITVCFLLALSLVCVPALHAAAETPTLPVTASSVYTNDLLPEYATDGDTGTRWASLAPGQEWLQLDFGAPVSFSTIHILWETAFAPEYEIQISQDGAAFTTVHHEMNGRAGDTEITGLAATARFVRILCQGTGPYPLYSIWEVSFPEAAPATALERMCDRIEEIRTEGTRAAREALRHDLAEAGVDEIAFATRPLYPDGHWYANIAYFAKDRNEKTYAKGGGLYVCRVSDDSVRPLVEDPEGTVRDPAVHYDGRTILFSYRPGGTETFHLYTVDKDGGPLTQLTHGEYDDIEPAWLPDGGIVFVSSRCRRWVNCWLTQVAIAHRCDADGRNIVPLSANLEQDNTPWPMPDGRILYTRWEYVDRSQVDYHHLWTMNPDGTAQAVHFGNMHPGGLFIDAKPVPGTDEVVFINSPGHGAREHAGFVALVDVKRGPDHLPAIRDITNNGYRDPYPVTSDTFLAAQGRNLMLVGRDGAIARIYAVRSANGLELHEPRPLVARSREPVLPPRVNYAKETGRLILSDIHTGRNMADVARGEITELLVIESLPKPINYTGGMDPLTYGGSFTLERVLGTIPVEADGSAYAELPANRAIFFVALDAERRSVKRMQTFLSVMPGETTSCVGCHEQRTTSGLNRPLPRLTALSREPSAIAPIPGIPEVFDFPRDIQPVLDRHCLPCHDYTPHEGAAHGPRAGGVILSGDHGPMFSHSYAALTVFRQVADGRDLPVSNLPPRAIGTSASPLMQKIAGGHHGVEMTAQEMDFVRYWIETGATYPGTYAALGNGSIGGYYANTLVENDAEWPVSQAAAEAFARRCASCHEGERSVARMLSDENGLSFWRPDNWNDPRLKRARHLVFNLTRPPLSMALLAPLAKEAGGYGLCATPDTPVFKDTTDPDYTRILAMCEAGKARLGEIGRFDMPGFQPPQPYIREMTRYGVLAGNEANNTALDPYALDRAYWRSFEQPFAMRHPAYTQK